MSSILIYFLCIIGRAILTTDLRGKNGYKAENEIRMGRYCLRFSLSKKPNTRPRMSMPDMHDA